MTLSDFVKLLQTGMNAMGSSLTVDGQFGAKTLAETEKYDFALSVKKRANPPKEEEKPPVAALPGQDPAWLLEARKHVGKKESDSVWNKFLSGFWKIVGLPGYKTIKGNSFAWCGLFCAAMLNLSGYQYIKNGAGAKNWGQFGVAIAYETQGMPAGAFVWIDHGRDGSQARCVGGGNHVTIVDGDCTAEDLKKLKVFPGMGGNQGDKVSRAMYPVEDVCAVRYPAKKADGSPVPPPVLPIKKSRGCTGANSPTGGKTTEVERIKYSEAA